MKQFLLNGLRNTILWSVLCCLSPLAGFAEGSVDLIKQTGYRLLLNGQYEQQFKVYAKGGEFINVGASNMGNGGVIKVYNPSGQLVTMFDDASSLDGNAVIHNYTEERAGPIGSGVGYVPGVVPVNEVGIWSIVFSTAYESLDFPTMETNYNWAYEEQTQSLGIIAWDVSVSKDHPANMGGGVIRGRLYTQQIALWMRMEGYPANPKFYIKTADGYLYSLTMKDLDPVAYKFSVNNIGLSKGDGVIPSYRSYDLADVVTSPSPEQWSPDSVYLYRPQARDSGYIVNHKIFFNSPDNTMPELAKVTDIFTNTTYIGWLNRAPSSVINAEITNAGFSGISSSAFPCLPGLMESGSGGNFTFVSNTGGFCVVSLDMNNNGTYTDAEDRRMYTFCSEGNNSVFWNGKDGLGNELTAEVAYHIPYKIEIFAGAVHIMFEDTESSGGFDIQLLNSPGFTDLTGFVYDHSNVNGPVSGGGTPGFPLVTHMSHSFGYALGEERLLNYW